MSAIDNMTATQLLQTLMFTTTDTSSSTTTTTTTLSPMAQTYNHYRPNGSSQSSCTLPLLSRTPSPAPTPLVNVSTLNPQAKPFVMPGTSTSTTTFHTAQSQQQLTTIKMDDLVIYTNNLTIHTTNTTVNTTCTTHTSSNTTTTTHPMGQTTPNTQLPLDDNTAEW